MCPRFTDVTGRGKQELLLCQMTDQLQKL